MRLIRDRLFIIVDICSKFDTDTWNVAASFRVNKELHTHTEPRVPVNWETEKNEKKRKEKKRKENKEKSNEKKRKKNETQKKRKQNSEKRNETKEKEKKRKKRKETKRNEKYGIP